MGKDRTLEIIKTEIDKLYGEYKDKFHQCGDQYHLGLIDGLDMAERVLDTIKSEKPINPDAAMKELDEKIALVKQRGTWDGVDVDKYMDEVRGREPEKPMNQDELEKAVVDYFESYWPGMETAEQCNTDLRFTPPAIMRLARHFAQWQKEQMMKEAVEGEYDCQYMTPAVFLDKYLDGIKDGDKVRVIVCKKED